MITRRKFLRVAAAGTGAVVGVLNDEVTPLTSAGESEHCFHPTYVVTEPCVNCKYTDCAAVCPVEAFHELPDRLYINSDTCIDCDACVPECPVEAIFADTNLPTKYEIWLKLNARASRYPVISQKQPALYRKSCKGPSEEEQPASSGAKSTARQNANDGAKTADLYFSKHGLWVRLHAGYASIGLTDYKQYQLQGVVSLELPKRGQKILRVQTLANIESVKATFKAPSPVSGLVLDVNSTLKDEPEQINTHPYDTGWLVTLRMSDKSELRRLMRWGTYEQYLKRSPDYRRYIDSRRAPM
jgi:ferredoxin